MASSIDFLKSELHAWSRASLQHDELETQWAAATDVSQNPRIPDPNIFTFSSQDADADTRFSSPTVAECAVHLELLEVFHHFRTQIVNSTVLDTVLGVEPEPRTVFRPRYRGYRRGYTKDEVQLRDTTFQERREGKWHFVLCLAAARFVAWLEVMERELTAPTAVGKSAFLKLPPLDILMIWHALLLNPRWFRTFESPLRNVTFPWQRLHVAIRSDQADWLYEIPQESMSCFRESTKLHPDLFQQLVQKDNSAILSDLLAQWGIQRDEAATRGIPLSTIVAAMRTPELQQPDHGFLSCLLQVVRNDNSTIVSLADAAARQAAFVEKMHRQLWIRSPALECTLHRARDRYAEFMALFGMFPTTTLVPTLDIDLVWHTHQCTSPGQYDSSCLRLAGRLIDHDDKLGKITLDSGIHRTTELYRIRFGKDYRLCLCWDCALLMDLTAHGEVDAQSSFWAKAQCVRETTTYYRAVEIARRKGQTLLPVRKELDKV